MNLIEEAVKNMFEIYDYLRMRILQKLEKTSYLLVKLKRQTLITEYLR